MDKTIKHKRTAAVKTSMRHRTGTVNFFNAEKNYGSVKDRLTRESYILYGHALNGPVKANDYINFEIEQTSGGLVAVNISINEKERLN